MKVFIKGKGEISLTQKDFIAAGGQGSVYGKNSTAYKIYADPKHMLPITKIQELSVLKNKNIIKPEDILLDEKNRVIGYTMPLVKNTYALCQLFPKAFRQRENLDHKKMFQLIKKLQELVKHCHDNKILIVDLNELNFLCSQQFDEIYAIDTDSYQTPSFPATAIMDSIRDRHSPNVFNEGTDWFSFAITSMQLFLGIHPYKGKHPSIKDIDSRMLKNISILNKDVSVPPVCYDFSIIPPNYMKWYEAVLEQGKRLPPPFGNEFVQLVATKIKTIVGNNKFDIKEIMDCVYTVFNFVSFPGVELIITESNTIFNNKKFGDFNTYKSIGISPKKNHIIFAKSLNGKLDLFDFTAQKTIQCDIDSEAVMAYNGNVYAKIGGNIVQINFIEIGNDITVSSKIVSQTMENATIVFEGVIFQNMLKAFYATIFPNSGTSYQINIKELSKYTKIVDAKYDNKILFVVAIDSAGKTDQLIFRFDENYENYDVRKHENISFTGINFVVLENGVCVNINPLDQVEVFTNNVTSQTLKIIDDPIISNDMTLYKNGMQVLFSNGPKLYSIKMK
jgi:serine/threonine protein kinase